MYYVGVCAVRKTETCFSPRTRIGYQRARNLLYSAAKKEQRNNRTRKIADSARGVLLDFAEEF